MKLDRLAITKNFFYKIRTNKLKKDATGYD